MAAIKRTLERAGILVSLLCCTPAIAAPSVTGNTITWPDNGWYQVQLVNDDGIIAWCEGGTSCTGPQGSYIVINHTTGERFEVTLNTNEPINSTAPLSALIAPPVNLRLAVYSSTTAELFWEHESNPFRIETAQVSRNGVVLGDTTGTSFFDNTRTPGERYRYEVFYSGPADGASEVATIRDANFPDSEVANGIESIRVVGSTITLPDDGYYQVQNELTYENICEGVRTCDVEPGLYIVINHTTGMRFDGFVVLAATQNNSSNPTISSVVVVGNTLSWPVDGWYEVQNAATFDSVCEGTAFCTVPAGTYNVINHTTGVRTENLFVSNVENVSSVVRDKPWELVAVQDSSGNQIAVSLQPGFEFTIQFSNNVVIPGDGDFGQVIDTVGGINVCNHYGGRFSINSNVLSLSDLGEDSAACERASELPAVIFGNVLFSSNSPPLISINADVLTMTSGSNEALIFNLREEAL